MRFSLVFACLIFVPSVWAVERGFPQSASPSETATLNSISDRVHSGDYSALHEAAKMPASVSIPYLYMWAGHGNDSPQHEIADQALRQVQGAVDYLRQDMSSTFSQGLVPVNDFEILGMIGTPEAAAVVAPYLFDPRLIDVNKDGRPYDVCAFAKGALEKMGFPDAPKDTLLTSYVSNSSILIEWQKWAIAKGFAPKGFSARVGAPAWMLRLDAMDRPAPTPLAAKSPQPIQTAGSPLSTRASSPVPTNTPSPTADPSAVETKAAGHAAGILVAACFFILLTIGGIFALKRRSRLTL